MTEARAAATRPAFRSYVTASEVAALDARAATAEQERDEARADVTRLKQHLVNEQERLRGHITRTRGERDDALADRDQLHAELARVRQQRDDLRDHLAHALDDRDRARAELGRAQEVIAEIRNNRERDDRALAMYDTRPGEEPTAPVPSRRAQEEPTACTCYPGGFSPGTYEGPMRDCPAHGELSAEATP